MNYRRKLPSQYSDMVTRQRTAGLYKVWHDVEMFNKDGVLVGFNNTAGGMKLHEIISAAKLFAQPNGWEVRLKGKQEVMA